MQLFRLFEEQSKKGNRVPPRGAREDFFPRAGAYVTLEELGGTVVASLGGSRFTRSRRLDDDARCESRLRIYT